MPRLDIQEPNADGYPRVIEASDGRWDSDSQESLSQMVKYASEKLKGNEKALNSLFYCPEKPLNPAVPVLYKYKMDWRKSKTTGKMYPSRYILIYQKSTGGKTASRGRL